MAYETGFGVEERVAALFQPDTLLPAQYLETYRRKSHLAPEKRVELLVFHVFPCNVFRFGWGAHFRSP